MFDFIATSFLGEDDEIPFSPPIALQLLELSDAAAKSFKVYLLA